MDSQTSRNAPAPSRVEFKPFVAPGELLPEATIRALVLGAILSVVFGIANAYLALKYGMTVSASIPAAVMSMAILRLFFKKVSVLENNIVQTVGSAGESLAAGITFTLPAFFIWAASPRLAQMGYDHDITALEIFILSMLGGALGILFMIPLRRYLVHEEHGKLAFPEGTACAEIIIAGEEGGSKARDVFLGMGIGAVYKILMNGFKVWPESLTYEIKNILKGGVLAIEATPALFGVGYILGPRVAGYMISGAVFGYLGVGPLLAFIGDQVPGVVFAPASAALGDPALSDMTSGQIRNFYIKYLGVGAVALGGFIALLRAFPTIIRTFKTGFGQMFSKADVSENIPRTDQDIKMKWVVTGLAVVTLIILFLPGIDIRFSAWMSSIIFGFLFVVVAARIVGEIGSTNSPVSGMTIATLLVTSFILMGFGASGVTGMVTTLMVGTVVCIAICMSGDIAQDLKTGYLLGATPRTQQLTEFVGLIFPAAAMGFTIFILNDAFGFVQTEATPNPLLAPQANVMATVIEGAFGASLPWAPIFVGGMVALGVELLGIGSLPFAIGLYLPLSLSTPIFAGGILHYVIKRSRGGSSLVEKRHQRGILFASGLVAGDALIGVFVAGMVAFGSGYRVYFEEHEGLFHSLTGDMGPYISSIAFVGLALFSWNYFRSKK